MLPVAFFSVRRLLPLLFSALLLSLFLILGGAGVTEIGWYIPIHVTLPNVTVRVGETVRFVWFGYHDVHWHPSGTCDETDAVQVAPASAGGTADYVMNQVGTFVFACDVAVHCEFGQWITVTVEAADAMMEPDHNENENKKNDEDKDKNDNNDAQPVTHTIEWRIPLAGSLPSMRVAVGDTVSFEWTGYHDVHWQRSGTCDETGAVQLASPRAGGQVSYTFTEAGTFVFACNVSGHCEVGQIITIIAVGATSGDGTPQHDMDTEDEEMSDEIPNEMPDEFPDEVPDETPDEISDETPDEMPDDIPDEIPDETPDETPNDMPDDSWKGENKDKNNKLYGIDWRIPGSADSLPTMQIHVGDRVQFLWSSGYHDVHHHPSGTCDATGAVPLASPSPMGHVEYQFQEAGTFVFACDVGSHCEFGQIITIRVDTRDDHQHDDMPHDDGLPQELPNTLMPVEVVDPKQQEDEDEEEIMDEEEGVILENTPEAWNGMPDGGDTWKIDWRIPDNNDRLPTMRIPVGDTVRFEWTGFHDVHWHPSGTCHRKDAVELATPSPGGSFEYTLTETGTFVFACEIGGHCQAGVIITIVVVGDDDDDEKGYDMPGVLDGPAEIPEMVLDGPDETPEMDQGGYDMPTVKEEEGMPVMDPDDVEDEVKDDMLPDMTKDGETYGIEWSIPLADSLPTMMIHVGDTVTFDWTGYHDVHRHPSGTCNETEAIKLASPSLGGQVSCTFTEAGTFVFACDVGNHCEAGQIITILVAETNDEPEEDHYDDHYVEINWMIPAGDALDPVTVPRGESVLFHWKDDYHDVHQHPSGTCDDTGAVQLADPSFGGNATFTAAAVGTFVFACDVGYHCENGQIVTIEVV